MSKPARGRRLAELRRRWRAWNRGTIEELSHIDYCLLPCAAQCGQCEGCLITAYRRDRMDEIEAEAAQVAAAPEQVAL